MFLGSLVADDSFTLLSAIVLLTGLMIGGQATLFGPLVGAVVVVYLPYYTSDLGQGQASAVMFGAGTDRDHLHRPGGHRRRRDARGAPLPARPPVSSDLRDHPARVGRPTGLRATRAQCRVRGSVADVRRQIGGRLTPARRAGPSRR